MTTILVRGRYRTMLRKGGDEVTVEAIEQLRCPPAPDWWLCQVVGKAGWERVPIVRRCDELEDLP
jgi:hypothetical protein